MSLRNSVKNFLSAIDASMAVVESVAVAANTGAQILVNNAEDMLKENERDRKIEEHLNAEERKLEFYKEKEKLSKKFQQYNANFCKEMDAILDSLK